MYKYTRILYWSEEDQSFIVEIPELPGCMTDGPTVQDAMDNAEIVIREWIETAKLRGQEIPAPKGKIASA